MSLDLPRSSDPLSLLAEIARAKYEFASASLVLLPTVIILDKFTYAILEKAIAIFPNSPKFLVIEGDPPRVVRVHGLVVFVDYSVTKESQRFFSLGQEPFTTIP